MSLINQVLRDLDRRARPPDRLPSAVRAVAAASARSFGSRVAACSAAGLLALCGVAWLAIGARAASPVMTADAAGAAGIVAAAAAAPSAPVAYAIASVEPDGPASRRLMIDPIAPVVESRLATASGDHLGDRHPTVSAQRGEAAQLPTAVAALASATAQPQPPAVALALASEMDSGSGQDRHDAVEPVLSVGTRSPRFTEVAAASPASSPARIEKRRASLGPAERAQAAFRLGLDAQQRGDDPGAAQHYLAALHDDPTLVPARIGLASVRLSQGRPVDAEEALQAGLVNHPPQMALALPLARLLAARGELAGATTLLQAGLSGPAVGNAEYRACYGAVLQRAGQHPEAIEQFTAALRLEPTNGVWWMGLGISLSAAHRVDAARSAYNQALGTGGLSPDLSRFVDQQLRQLL